MIGVGLGLSQSRPFLAAQTSLAQVASGATLLGLWEPHGRTTRSGTPAASGTAPPAVTLTFSGLGATLPIGLKVGIVTTGGARGTALFRYSADNGTTWIESGIATAATYACVGAAAGITLNFPVGTYATDNVWDDVVASVADVAGVNAMTPPSGARAPYIRLGLNGLQYVANDSGGTRCLSCALDLPAPGTTPFWILLVTRARSVAATSGIYCGAGSGAALLYQGNDAVSHAYNGAVVGAGATLVGSWVRFRQAFSHSAGDGYRYGGSTLTADAGNVDPPNHFELLGDLPAAFPLTGDIATAAVYAGVPTNLTAIDTFLTAKFPGVVT